MSRVYRQQYTRPIPADAVQVTVKDKKGRAVAAVRFREDGKTITAPITQKGKGAGKLCRVPSPVWYGRYSDADGIEQRVPLSENKVAAEQMLNELVKKAEMGKAGILDPYEEHNKKRLAEHLIDFRRHLEAKGNAPSYVETVYSRLRDLLTGCKFVFPPDLSASRVAEWLAGLRQPGRPRVDLEPGKDSFTLNEVAALLGIKAESVAPVVRRQRLQASGQGKARRFPRATVETLLDRQGTGASVETTNQYLTHLKVFLNWMKGDKRTGANPFDHLKPGNAEVDRRHDRRELEAEELRRLLAAARDSSRTFRGLDGRDRYHLYAAACGTGFRASGLASLTPESFDLDSALPTVTLAARMNKSRKLKVQPLAADLAALFRNYLAGCQPGQPVWPGTWASDRVAADMLRIDLDATGIPYAVEGPDGPLFADFHSLRHTYLTLGGRAGIDLRTLQELAGHSDPKLTARYSHRRLYDLAGAVEKLPRLLPEDSPAGTLQATGTDSAAIGDKEDTKPCFPYTPLTQAPDGGRVRLMVVDGTGEGEGDNTTGLKPLPLQGFEAGRGSMMACDGERATGFEPATSSLGNYKPLAVFGVVNPGHLTLYDKSLCFAMSIEIYENQRVFPVFPGNAPVVPVVAGTARSLSPVVWPSPGTFAELPSRYHLVGCLGGSVSKPERLPIITRTST